MALFGGMNIFPQFGSVPQPEGTPAIPQQEAPSFIEMLAAIAGQVYGGDERYSAAAGLGKGISGVLGDVRERRNEQLQRAAIAKQFPNLGPLMGLGMKVDLGDLIKQQQVDAENKRLEGLPAQLDEISKLATPQERAMRMMGLYARNKLGSPPGEFANAAIGLPGGGKFPTTNEILAQDLWGEARAPKDQAEAGALAKRIQSMTAQGAAQRVTEEAGAKSAAEGLTPFLSSPVKQMLSSWGVNPRAIKPGDPMLDEAAEASDIAKARRTVSQAERNAYRTAGDTVFNIGRLEKHIADMQQKGTPLDPQTIYYEWLKYHSMQSQEPIPKAFAAYVSGPPGPEYQGLFSLIGQTRNRLAPIYMPPGMRSAAFLKQSQEHLPVEGAPLEAVMDAITQLKPLVTKAKEDLAPQEDPKRIRMIQKLMSNEPGLARSRAEYLVDKVLGLTLDNPMDKAPVSQPALPAE